VLVREGLVLLLRSRGIEVVGEAADGDGLLELVLRERPDAALVDIRMPPTHTDEGLVAAARIRKLSPGTGVLVLSQHLEPSYAVRLLEDSPRGAGYLLKERVGRVAELEDALRRVAAGECVVDRAVVDELVARTGTRDPLSDLSERELEILALMAEGRSNQGLCEKLFLSPKTVETHIRSVFGKLGLLETPLDNRRVLAVLAFLRAR
jgi:serine/threonine-protein kinase